MSRDTVSRLDAYFKKEQAEVREKLTCKKAAKQRQLEAIRAKSSMGALTAWNGGEGGRTLRSRAEEMAREVKD